MTTPTALYLAALGGLAVLDLALLAGPWLAG